ncbi:MAG TPA: hypothetical protein VK745_21865 [Polyangiaceae bacterium]|jgi:hypothetical protein|nr:hypothetical protein [Polyangiaceae bacterium]
MKFIYGCLVGVVLGGCVNSAELNAKLQSQVDAAAPSVVMKPAAFELNCDASQLTMQKVGQAQYGVSGCGKRATFGVMCRFDGDEIVKDSCTSLKMSETQN